MISVLNLMLVTDRWCEEKIKTSVMSWATNTWVHTWHVQRDLVNQSDFDSKSTRSPGPQPKILELPSSRVPPRATPPRLTERSFTSRRNVSILFDHLVANISQFSSLLTPSVLQHKSQEHEVSQQNCQTNEALSEAAVGWRASAPNTEKTKLNH